MSREPGTEAAHGSLQCGGATDPTRQIPRKEDQGEEEPTHTADIIGVIWTRLDQKLTADSRRPDNFPSWFADSHRDFTDPGTPVLYLPERRLVSTYLQLLSLGGYGCDLPARVSCVDMTLRSPAPCAVRHVRCALRTTT